jgi:hypothetical protein
MRVVLHGGLRKRSKDDKERRQRLQRGGLGINVKSIKDKKLKGQLKHVEKVVKEAQAKAAKVSEWLLPSDSGLLEAEGERRLEIGASVTCACDEASKLFIRSFLCLFI